MSLKDAFLRTRQAALDIAVERARPKTWKAGRVTQDGVTTVTTDPVAADTPDGTHAELLAAGGRYRALWDSAHTGTDEPVQTAGAHR